MEAVNYTLSGGRLHYFHRAGPLVELLVDVCDHLDQLTDDESAEALTVYAGEDGWSAVLLIQRTDREV